MKLKVYRARSVADALAEVKRDLGPDAVILHTKHAKAGGVLGVGARTVVEVTASNDPNIASARRPSVGRRARQPVPTPQPVSSAHPSGPLPERTAGSPSLPRPVPATARRAYGIEAVGRRQAPSQQVVGAEVTAEVTAETRASTAAVVEAPSSSADPAMRQELECIRKMVGQVLRVQRDPAALGSDPDALLACYLKLTENAVATELADDIVSRVRGSLSTDDLSDGEVVRDRVLEELASLMPVTGHSAPPSRAEAGKPTTIALVGPTGVGKTTTVAKLAATYKLRHGRRVGLITADTYRIAAVEQLRTYAEIIGIPLKTAMTPLEMGASRASLSECDVILIDTAGRSPRDSGRLDELREGLRQARPDETHLVVSSTSCPRAAAEIAEGFGSLGPDRIIYTKLDEAVGMGVLLSTARKLDLKVSYLTNGQEVPDHIAAAEPSRLAKLVLDGPEPFGGRLAS
ncbi:MAG: flagellar biosynthesis protein FlhF [Planctomycetota bacterium]